MQRKWYIGGAGVAAVVVVVVVLVLVLGGGGGNAFAALEKAFEYAGIPWQKCRREDCGDGVFVLVQRDRASDVGFPQCAIPFAR